VQRILCNVPYAIYHATLYEKLFLVLLLAGAMAATALAQNKVTVCLSGILVDAVTGQSIPNQYVRLYSTLAPVPGAGALIDSVLTDSSGSYADTLTMDSIQLLSSFFLAEHGNGSGLVSAVGYYWAGGSTIGSVNFPILYGYNYAMVPCQSYVHAHRNVQPNLWYFVAFYANYYPFEAGTTYAWDFGDGSLIDTTAAPTHAYNAAGNFTVSCTATSPTGCVMTDTAVVSAQSCRVYVVSTPTPTNANNGFSTIVFADSSCSVFGGGLAYNWDFGNGTTSTQASPWVTYELPGLYTVSLTISDSTGCTDTFMQTQGIAVGDTCAGSDLFAAADGVLFNDLGGGFAGIVIGNSSPVVDYSWDFGNGDTASGAIVQYFYPAGNRRPDCRRAGYFNRCNRQTRRHDLHRCKWQFLLPEPAYGNVHRTRRNDEYRGEPLQPDAYAHTAKCRCDLGSRIESRVAH